MNDSCLSCEDIGVVFVEKKEPMTSSATVNAMMKCFCCEGDRAPWQLPQWRSEFNRGWDKQPCPKDWFKDVDGWIERVRSAEEFWRNHGEVYEPRH